MNDSAEPHSESGPITILAVDPGSMKCGIAVVSYAPLTVHFKAIVPAIDAIDQIGLILKTRPSTVSILLGDGTGSRRIATSIRQAFPGHPLIVVDEFGTSLLARSRYCCENPARGWRRLLPRGLRLPEEPYDDYVAIILAERWLRSRAKS